MTSRFLPLLFLLSSTTNMSAQSPLLDAETVYSSEVHFDFGKHDLRPDADPVLAEIANYISDKKNLLIKITAHTDSIGSLENNMSLSKRRSNSIKSVLSSMGIADSLLTISTFGETMPVATNRTEEGRQHNRRATIEIVKWKSKPTKPTPQITLLEGNVRDKNDGHGLESMVVIRGKEFRDTIYTDTSGYFKKELPIGAVIGIDAFADCHFFGSEMTKTQNEPLRMVIPLAPILTGDILDLNNLYFVGNQPVLLDKSKPELPKILRFLQTNPQMKIEVAGHINLPNTPDVATDTWHYKLSHDRAKVVYDYLIANGISVERISFKGYGNWEMRFPRAESEQQQALNRRVEMKVLEGGCE